MPFAKEVTSRVAFGKQSGEAGWGEMINVLIEESNYLLGSFHFGDYFALEFVVNCTFC